MSRQNYLFTSESVSEGHPDKVCDRISDTIVDAFLAAEPQARVAAETLATTNRVVIAGETRGPKSVDNALIEHLTREIAECIYVGVSTDTGCFKFSNTTAHTHAVAAACLTAGIDGGEINRVLFETKSRPRFEMERIVFDTMEFHENGAIAVAVLWRRDIDHVGADMDDLDSIASLTRQIEGVQIGITLTEKPDGTVRVSVRTTKEMDASAICKRVGGGGHVRAAGASFTCGMDEAKAEMLRVAKEQFHAAD